MWNAAFDRWIWNAVMVPKYRWPPLKLEQVLCAQAQAEGNNLPGGLKKACDTLGTPLRKDTKGAGLIRTLSSGTRESWDSKKYEQVSQMGHFRAYCVRDVESMRDAWLRCRPLTLEEWAQYHASERINDRGVMVDTQFARTAKQYARAEAQEIDTELRILTDDPDMSASAHLRKAAWLHEHLWCDQELQELVERPAKLDDKPRYSCDRPTRDAVLEMITQAEHADRFEPEQADRVVKFLELIEAGNSAAVKKFTAIAERSLDDRIYGSYSFNGAGQTGRFSSRGIQLHNIIRAPVSKKDPDRAVDAIEMIMDGADADALRAEFGFPVSRLLARLIRPTFIAAPGRILVWADWDQIEARVLPWLADSILAEEKLQLYRDGVDVYVDTAAKIGGIDHDEVTAEQRQVLGKLPELALGFAGGIGALSAMARGYGISLDEEIKQELVNRWRKRNRWAVGYWQKLWDAAINAYKNPNTPYAAGRVSYFYSSVLMGGTLICVLPDNRPLVYPQFKYGPVEVTDQYGRKRMRLRASFVKGFSNGAARVDLWHGTLAENATQGTAASVLRGALVNLDQYHHVVLHTHDEIVSEVYQARQSQTQEELRDAMTTTPDWAQGLPLTVSLAHGPYYSKI
jgi:DNA polymerase